MRSPLLFLAALALAPAAPLPLPLAAQLRSSRPQRTAPNLPRLLVANPHPLSLTDSAAAVRIGAALRERTEGVAGKWYAVIPRAQMNEALLTYGFPEDAVLHPMVARQLAGTLNARAVIVSTLARDQGRMVVEARLTATGDDAGYVARTAQAPAAPFEEAGKRLGDSLANAFKALPDARECETLRGTNPARAIAAATKALRVQPNHGLAELCLARIALARKAPTDSVVAHLKKALQGDRLSLDAWTALGEQYQAQGDTANTVATFTEMLRVAPTNEKLREAILKYLLGAGKLDVAERVADEGIALDSSNAEMWDLRATVCILQEDQAPKVLCALESIDRVYQIDTTKADTLFVNKAIYAATRPVAPDTARLVRWTDIGVRKFPRDPGVLGGRVTRFSWTGPLDSLVAATRTVMAVDSTDLSPVVRAVEALAKAKRGREALELGQSIERLGGAGDKQNLAIILAQNTVPLIQQGPDQDLPLAADLARKALAHSQPGTPLFRLASYGLGLSTFFQAAALDQETERAKSCENARKMKTLFDEAGPALRAGRDIQAAYVDTLLKGLEWFGPRVASMLRAYCKGDRPR